MILEMSRNGQGTSRNIQEMKLTKSEMMKNGQILFRTIDMILEMPRNTKKWARNGQEMNVMKSKMN